MSDEIRKNSPSEDVLKELEEEELVVEQPVTETPAEAPIEEKAPAIEKETEKLSNENSMSLEFFDEQQQRIKELQAKLDDANATLNQRYVDENETVWTIPTPEAYAIVCKRMHGLKTSNELLRIRLSDYKAWIQMHRTDRRLKWIDVNDAMPKEDELIVLLMDNGRIDIGYKSRKGYWVSHWFMVVAMVTHWMPIPQIPNE